MMAGEEYALFIGESLPMERKGRCFGDNEIAGAEETMNEETIKARVIETLLEVAPDIDKGELDLMRSFRAQFDVDSADFLNFVLSFERKLGVEIPEVDYPKLASRDCCMSYFESVCVD